MSTSASAIEHLETPMSKNIQIPIMVNSCTGKMGKAVMKAADLVGLELVPVTLGTDEESGQTVEVCGKEIHVHGPSDRESVLASALHKYPNMIVVDYTAPAAVNGNAELYCKVGVPFVMGTTGGDRDKLYETVENSNVYAVISPQMGKQVVAFLAAMEIMAKQFPGAFSHYCVRSGPPPLDFLPLGALPTRSLGPVAYCVLSALAAHEPLTVLFNTDASRGARTLDLSLKRFPSGTPLSIELLAPGEEGKGIPLRGVPEFEPPERILGKLHVHLRTEGLGLGTKPCELDPKKTIRVSELGRRRLGQGTLPTMRRGGESSVAGSDPDLTIVLESHQAGKLDTSGTAKAIISCFQKLGVSFDMDQIQMLQDPKQQLEMVGVAEEHISGHAFHMYHITSAVQTQLQTVSFEFKHNVCGRSIYAEGTVDAVIFLSKKVQSKTVKRIYNMIDVLQEGNMR